MSLDPLQKPESRAPVSPQIALRVAALGTLALVMFGIIFFRLWYLQILTGEHYVAQQAAQRERPLPIAAPRGQILARGGQVLVSSKTTNDVQIIPSQLPPGLEGQLTKYKEALEAAEKKTLDYRAQLKDFQGAHPHVKRLAPSSRRQLRLLQREANALPHVRVAPLPASDGRLRSLFRRLGALLHIKPRAIDEEVVRSVDATSYAPVTIDTATGPGPRTVLGERQGEFPGVVQRPVDTTAYPFKEMAAQIFGHVGPVSEPELKQKKGPYKGMQAGTIVGQNGLEYYYDKYLQGTPGKERIQVNASGEPLPSTLAPLAPKPGFNLQTTIDLPLQKAGETALRGEIKIANETGRPADGGAFVVLDPVNGEVLAMASYPSYNPEVFTKPISEAEYERLFPSGIPSSGGQPLLNRAVEDGYATGSAFKPITSIGALEAGVITPTETFGAGKCLDYHGQPYCNAAYMEFGNVALAQALEVSSDTYFYTVGMRANAYGPVIQRMAHRLGIGRETGIDLPSELEGVIPDKEWLEGLVEKERKCTRKEHKPCGYIFEPNAIWTTGDNMNLAVGQGYLLTSPLQMAVAWSAEVNAYRTGGEATVPTPHLGKQIDEPNGALWQALKFPPRRRFHLNPEYLHYIFEGIHDGTVGPGGTSTNVWVGWNEEKYPTYGKTGTAERVGQLEQAWYMCFLQSASGQRPIVIAVTVEQGGYGDQAAAPVARALAQQYYHQPKAKLIAGQAIP